MTDWTELATDDGVTGHDQRRKRRWLIPTTLVVVAAGAALGVTLFPGKARPPIMNPSPAVQLRAMDVAAKTPNLGSEADYTRAFDTLSARCQEQGQALADEVGSVLWLLNHNGITDENHLTVMQHLAAPLPIGAKQLCAQVGDGYVSRREEHA
ncbi:hypothetical protein E6W39_19730 [Kitasatospora acidiphila]|uniref:Uncharacterized protein n=1 Tax=Kitasatospora acidiphila TaxID=2567942 RepID=A0A540W6U1_9ACTN|nr:hypothetical protein [Kitasatospora acidiphila]TQF04054.1 hypothetical protein E6W39_19730 [Kitasatospora acidiphila]